MKTDGMELTRYLIGQGRRGRDIYFANNCILLSNNLSDVYVLNLAVGIMVILVSPGGICPCHTVPLARLLQELL